MAVNFYNAFMNAIGQVEEQISQKSKELNLAGAWRMQPSEKFQMNFFSKIKNYMQFGILVRAFIKFFAFWTARQCY